MQIPITRWLLYKFVKGTAQGAAELTCQNIVPETFNFSWLSGDLEVICAVLVSWSEMTGLFPSEYDVLTASSKVLDSRRCQQTKKATFWPAPPMLGLPSPACEQHQTHYQVPA